MSRSEAFTTEPLDMELSLRAIPVQKRAKDTVNLILQTAEELLIEKGTEGFNTNLLAERANIRVNTIYRYFPNKFALLNTLAQQQSDWERQFLNEDLELLADPQQDWRKVLATIARKHFKLMLTRPGIVAIRRAMFAIPELRGALLAHNKRVANDVCDTFRQRGMRLPDDQLYVVAQTLCNMTDVTFDYLISGGDADKHQMIKELILTQQSYLQNYID